MARPSPAVEESHKIGRDVGLAESGFALPLLQECLYRSCSGVNIGGQKEIRYNAYPLSSGIRDLSKIRLFNATDAEDRYFYLRPELFEIAQTNG